ncbi:MULTISPECIES: hypothetical protein [Vibrio]|uniref:Uncharacterized protein n=1 Tax=Vibrio casei TaxID=673372 RepID=A0A368LMS7_9VIBR|nr:MULTISPECIES: hypothetical protein [Vibrio]RCS73210.1 hypothetical protein CIK83_06025 [Vibrio casei]SJN18801.1 hypothetical protein FM109_02105 [Vibrio casei]HBV78017.1 hypothetical protein [Vibrio sp.]
MKPQQLEQQLVDLQKQVATMQSEIQSLTSQIKRLQTAEFLEEEKTVFQPVKDSRPKNEWLKVALILGGILLWLLLEKNHLL